jgi:hypothetical protein
LTPNPLIDVGTAFDQKGDGEVAPRVRASQMQKTVSFSLPFNIAAAVQIRADVVDDPAKGSKVYGDAEIRRPVVLMKRIFKSWAGQVVVPGFEHLRILQEHLQLCI